MARINIELPEETHRRAKARAALKGMNLKDYIIKAIEEKTKNKGGK